MPKQTQKIILWLVAAAILGGSSPLPALAETVQDFSSQYALKRVGAGKRGDDYPGRYLVYSQGDTTPPGFWERGKATLQGKQAVSTIHAEGEMAVVIVSHDMDVVAELARRVWVLAGGRTVMRGSVREIFARVEELRELGLGIPQVSELAYELRRAGRDVRADVLTADELAEALWTNSTSPAA